MKHEPQHPRISAEMYRVCFDHAGDPIFVLDMDGNYLEVNHAACEHVGYDRDELLRVGPRQIIDPKSAEHIPQCLDQVKISGSVTFETVHLHRDGTRIPVEMHVRLVEHDGQRLLVNICRNIASRKQNEIEYRKIIQATGEGYWMVSVSDARIIDVNDTFCDMVGYTREELLAMTISDLEAVESPEDTAGHIRKVMETGHDLFETRHRHKDGHLVELEISVSYADIRGGVIFVFVRDISERKRQEAELRLAALVVDVSTATVMVTDADNFIVGVNPAFTQITGYAPGEVIGRNPRLLSSGRQSQEFYRNMWCTLTQTGHWEGEWWNRRKDGEEYAEQVNMNLLRNENGSIFRHVKIATDITDKKRLDDQIWRQANYDAVTGLPNRRLLLDRLVHEMKKCDRTGESLAVFYIDLDHFKEVNDEFGHAAGDHLLVEAARRIGSCIRSSDTVARLGGDEFTVLLADLAGTSRVDTVAQQIIQILAQPFRLDQAQPCISASVGIAIYPDDALDVDELMRKADVAMYAAKSGGRNQFSYV